MDNNRVQIQEILERHGDSISEGSLDEITELLSSLRYSLFESEELLDNIQGTVNSALSDMEGITDKIGVYTYLALKNGDTNKEELSQLNVEGYGIESKGKLEVSELNEKESGLDTDLESVTDKEKVK